jgi:hypothetical protein
MPAQFKAVILPFVLSTRMMVASRPEELLELEAMAAKLLEAACKLPPGETRQGVLKEIGRLRARIDRLPRDGNGHGPPGGHADPRQISFQ